MRRTFTVNGAIEKLRNVGAGIEARVIGDLSYYIIKPRQDRPFGIKMLGVVDFLCRTGDYFYSPNI